jgi:hypothetical protein
MSHNNDLLVRLSTFYSNFFIFIFFLLATAPSPCVGWLRKKGQLFPSIKRRFFILEAGVISYYKKDVVEQLKEQHHSADQQNSDSCLSSSRGNRRIPKPLGKFPILDYEIYNDVVSGNIELFLNPGKKLFCLP